MTANGASPVRKHREAVVMVAPALNPANQGFRYRCLQPARELQRRGWRIRVETPSEGCRADLLVIMSDVCLADDACAAAAFRMVEEGKRRGAAIVVTETDHRGYNPEGNLSLARKADAVARLYALADELVVTTPALAEAVRPALRDETPVTVVPDALERPADLAPTGALARIASWRHWHPRRALSRLNAALTHGQPPGTIRLVWFGGHGTNRGPAGGMLDLRSIQHPLEDLARRRSLSLTVISNNSEKFETAIRPFRLPTHYLDWNRLTFHAALRWHHVCVLPIQSSPWTACKSNNRVVTAVHAGLLCVADAIPAYEPLRAVARIGPVAENLPQALEDFEQFTPVARQRLIAQVEADWAIECVADGWERVIQRHLRRNQTPAEAQNG